MGAHSLTAKDADGNVIASKEFSIVEGTPLSVTENVITAENRSIFTMTIQANDGELVFTALQEGDHTINTDADNSQESSSPQTGGFDIIELRYSLIILVVCGCIMALTCGKTKRNYRHDQ